MPVTGRLRILDKSDSVARFGFEACCKIFQLNFDDLLWTVSTLNSGGRCSGWCA